MRRVACFLLVTSSLLLVTAPAHAGSGGVVVGIWPQTYAQFLQIEAASGLSIPYFRARQQDGQFDRNLVGTDEQAAAAAGYSLGMNIQPKTGTGSNRTGILYTDISAQIQAASGPYYDKLVSFAHEVLALPTYGRIPNYLQFHSEASTQSAQGVQSAQPYSGTAVQYQQCYALVHQLFQSLGVTNKIYWQMVLDQGTYAGGKGGAAAWYPTDPSTYDLVGVDGYYHSPNWISPATAFGPALAFAQSQGKQIWIDETGADEGGPTNSATAKAAWYASLESYIEANGPSVAGVVYSNAMDGGNWFFDSKLQGGRAVPNYTGTSWAGWTTSVTALQVDLPSTHTLSINPAGSGGGEVTSLPSGVDCGATCSGNFIDGASVTLTATAADGSTFMGWSGACSGSAPTCTVTVTAAMSVNAQFDMTQHSLTITRLGTGTGAVSSDSGGISCPSTCSASYALGTSVTLNATPDANSAFTGWGGDCTGTTTCQVSMSAARNVTATFAPILSVLTVGTSGNGDGSVSGDSGGIACPGACSASYASGAPVTLTATPGANSTFTGWSAGACSGVVTTCSLTMNSAESVTATFTLVQHTLTITRSGTGTGTVGGDPGGITCGATCSASVDHGAALTLTAVPTPGSGFIAWSGGGCSGTVSTCVVTVDADTAVNAQFDLIQHSLTITRLGTGTGTVTSDVGGISCGAACMSTVAQGTSVTLSASPAAGSSLTGWSGGGCSGTAPTCVVTMGADSAVSATFTLDPQLLNLTIAGGGGGTVTSVPAGIGCLSTCSASFASGIPVTLSATPDANSAFTGWTGDCTGTTTCQVSMSAARNVTATFAPILDPVNVTLAGTGAGAVTSSPAGITCGTTCGGSFDQGGSISLSAAAGANSSFTGWTGDCTGGTNPCVLGVGSAKNVTASFALIQHSLTITRSGIGTGTVTSDLGGINCGATCVTTVTQGTPVTLTEVPSTGSSFTGWGGGCSGTATTCATTMNANTTVTATFALNPQPLNLTISGTAGGAVTSVPAGINCTMSCAASFTAGTSVTLSAAPAGNSRFTGWSGDCSGTATCQVAMSAAHNITATFVTSVATPLDDNNPAVAYGGWVGVADAAANGGFYRMSGVKGDKATWTSPATTSLTWVTRTGPDQGKASVTIDGTNEGTVDLFAVAPASVAKTYSGLANKAHTVVVKALGTKNAASTGSNVRLDAFVVGTTTKQESDSGIQYDAWKYTAQTLAGGGGYHSATANTESATVRFTGTAIDWITATGKGNGKASVTIDGVSKGTVDLYAAAAHWQVKIGYAGLAPGPHTMVIQVLGQKNAAANGQAVVVDGFVVAS